MKKIKLLCAIAIFAILLNGCKKDDSNLISNNSTNGKTTLVFNSSKTYETMIDQEGNEYKTIIIGTQTWMAENLRTTKYRDGTSILEVTGNDAWGNLSTSAYCNYNNTDNIDTIATYGRLYNWYAVSDIHNLAPNGWHIPTDTEWTQLTDSLDGEYDAGVYLKESETTHWSSSDEEVTNETGFTAIPSGSRTKSDFWGIGRFCYFWTATRQEPNAAWLRGILVDSRSVYRHSSDKEFGLAVRCVKD